MSEILFFRQTRRDGGVRTGIEVEGDPALHHFANGKADSDPVLLWFIDLLFDAPELPREPELVREWLVSHKRPIARALSEFADELEAGVDVDALPVSKQFLKAIPHVKLRITCSAARRADARKMASRLRELARRWTSAVNDLDVVHSGFPH